MATDPELIMSSLSMASPQAGPATGCRKWWALLTTFSQRQPQPSSFQSSPYPDSGYPASLSSLFGGGSSHRCPQSDLPVKRTEALARHCCRADVLDDDVCRCGEALRCLQALRIKVEDRLFLLRLTERKQAASVHDNSRRCHSALCCRWPNEIHYSHQQRPWQRRIFDSFRCPESP